MPRRESAAVALAAALTLTACSGSGTDDNSSPKPQAATTTVAEPLRCNVDLASDHAKDVIERVGGLHGDGYVVRFAQSTELGVVALVEGDLAKAAPALVDDYGVSAVAAWDPSVQEIGKGGFRQIERVVSAYCP